MQVQVPEGFPYKTFFMPAASAGGPRGVLIMKQTRTTGGALAAEQMDILMSDEQYNPPPPPPAVPTPPPFDHNTLLVTHFENDLAAFKPETDLVVVRDSRNRALFGTVRVPSRLPATNLLYGWQHTALANDPPGITNPRPALSGDAASFTPDVEDKYKLPDGFQDSFFNGGRVKSTFPEPGEQVIFDPLVGSTVSITIPPRLTVTVQPPSGAAPAVSTNLDTVIYDESGARFLIVWRATFPWEDRLLTGTLMVSE